MKEFEENNKEKFPGGTPRIDWRSSKEEQWEMLSRKLEEKPASKQVFMFAPVLRYAAAASLVVLVTAGLFMRFYTEEYNTLNGERALVELPDKSTVRLNADSEIAYHPYWWWMNRDIELRGEGYFEVEKGSSFSVLTNNGTTTVLGTKFNVFSREDKFEVTCMEGRVAVSAPGVPSQELTKDQVAVLKGSNLVVNNVEKPENAISWTNNYYIFTAADITDVIDELERQYDVKIQYKGEPAVYTGSFRQEMEIQDVLDILTRTLGLSLEKSGETYILK